MAHARRDGRRASLASIARKIAVRASLLVLAFLVAEVALRVLLAVLPAPGGAPYVSDAYCGYRLRPGPLAAREERPDDHINAWGFRDREHTVEKAEGTFRLLGIGDSFVYGVVPLEDNFLRVCEDRLNRQRSPGSESVEMILMGIGGYTPENELGLMRSQGLALSPDAVVLNFFVGNDVVGLAMPGVVYRGQLYYVGSSRPWLNIMRHSRIFLLAESTILTRLKARVIGEQSAARTREDSLAPEETGSMVAAERGDAEQPVSPTYLHIQRKRLPVYLSHAPWRVERQWRQVEGILVDFDEVCRGAGVPWILHVIPSELQVDERVRSEVLGRLGLSPDEYDFDLPQRRLRAIADEHGFTVHDPLPALRLLNDSRGRLYAPNDTHWNTLGNRVAGELLADAVAAHLMN